jgi:hypothetical protein
MTDTKPTLNEQIAHQKECAESAHRLFKPEECAMHFEKLASLERLKQIESAEMPEPVAWYDDDLEIHYGKTHPENTGTGWKPLYGPELLAYAQRKEAELSDAVHLNDEQAQRVFRAEAEASELQKRFEVEVDAFYKERERAESAEREREALIAECGAVAQKLINLSEFHEKSAALRDLAITLRAAIDNAMDDGRGK